ncbi:MAG: polyphenol oxidase family protein, partial [Actinomycetes bacterium]
AASIGLSATDLVLMQGVHGANVVVVEQGSPGLPGAPGFDALVTKTPGVGLVALAADCVPIVLADVANQVIGAVHCGWRGLAAGVVPAALAQMHELGADQIHAVIGPSICANCYPVPPQRVLELIGALSASVAAVACPKFAGVGPEMAVACIDVGAGVRAQLAESGVTALTLAGCTAHSEGLFSYRRDGQTGRQGM